VADHSAAPALAPTSPAAIDMAAAQPAVEDIGMQSPASEAQAQEDVLQPNLSPAAGKTSIEFVRARPPKNLPPRRGFDTTPAAQNPPAAAGRRAGAPATALPPADDLFQPKDTDRSPQAWRARLAQAALQEAQAAQPGQPTPAATSMPTPAPQAVAGASAAASVPTPAPAASPPDRPIASGQPPAPLPEATRRFLQPLVGIDPASTRIHRDAAADQVAAAYAADAVTAGDDIALAAGKNVEAPETIGVLAHELTHVARQRTPRFVPPIIRNAPGRSPVAANSEESIAQQAEARVIQAVHEAGSPDPPTAPRAQATPPPSAQAPAPAAEQPPDRTRPWGNLPAPWEPLPAWMTTPSALAAPAPPFVPAASSVPASPPAPAAPAPAAISAPAVVGAAPQPAAPAVQRAAQSRTLEQPTAPEPSPAPPPAAEQVAPDLDALARQVYAVLKRRLATERRREG
jgi:hypothetical protein